MLDEIIAGTLALPLWVQGFLVYFVLTLVVMLGEPLWRSRRMGKRFAELAAASHAVVVPGNDKDTASFALERAGRVFTVRRELRSAPRSSSYRGPRGHLLFCETPLRAPGWQHHVLDISNAGGLAERDLWPFRSGDADFDRRFTAWQGGTPVRSEWLDGTTRAAISALFDTVDLGTLWVRDGLLQFVTAQPKSADAAALERTLRALGAVAEALERTAAA